MAQNIILMHVKEGESVPALKCPRQLLQKLKVSSKPVTRDLMHV